MNLRTHTIAAICAGLLLASCGKDEGEPIPVKRADTLERLLKQVQSQSDAGSCVTLLEKTIPRLEAEARRLPNRVGEDTQTTIEDGVAHLRDLAETDCAEQQQEELPDTTESTTEESTTTPTAPEETTTEETTSEETTPEETAPEETTPPEETPGQDPGSGNGGTPPGQGGTPPGLQP